MNAKEASELMEFLLIGQEWVIWDSQRKARLQGVAASSVGRIRLPRPPGIAWIDKRTEIGDNSCLLPNSYILGATTLGARVCVNFDSIVEGSFIEDDVEIGIDNIIRRAHIGARTKIPYNAELVDIEIGPDTNIARNVTVSNFDGLRKNQTRIGAGCFIGTDVNINGGVIIGDEVRIYPKLFVTTRWIPDHAWARDCRCEGRPHPYDIEPNRSFKIPEHWRWIVTRKSVNPIGMRDLLRELGKEFRGRTRELVIFWEKEGRKRETPFYLP